MVNNTFHYLCGGIVNGGGGGGGGIGVWAGHLKENQFLFIYRLSGRRKHILFGHRPVLSLQTNLLSPLHKERHKIYTYI